MSSATVSSIVCALLAGTIALAESRNITIFISNSTTNQIADTTTSAPPPSSASGYRVSVAVGVVIAVTGVAIVVSYCLYGLFNCYINKDKGDLEGVEYCIQEEYEAKINFTALDNLDPLIRAGIDMDMLATLTNTDPKLLDKYRYADAASLQDNKHMHASQESLHKHYSLTVQESFKRHSLDQNMRRSCITLPLIDVPPPPSITMSTDKQDDVEGNTFIVQCKGGMYGSNKNLLHVLSNAAMPRSSSEPIKVGGGAWGGAEAEAADEEIARQEAAKEKRREREAGKEEAEGRLGGRAEVGLGGGAEAASEEIAREEAARDGVRGGREGPKDEDGGTEEGAKVIRHFNVVWQGLGTPV